MRRDDVLCSEGGSDASLEAVVLLILEELESFCDEPEESERRNARRKLSRIAISVVLERLAEGVLM